MWDTHHCKEANKKEGDVNETQIGRRPQRAAALEASKWITACMFEPNS